MLGKFNPSVFTNNQLYIQVTYSLLLTFPFAMLPREIPQTDKLYKYQRLSLYWDFVV